MPEPVSLEEIKVHLRLDAGETDDDAALQAMIIAARCHCETFTNRKLVGASAEIDAGVIAVFAHAIKVLCATWYDDRAGELASPAAVVGLLRPLRVLGAPQ